MNIKNAISQAEQHKSKLTDEYISKLDGLSSPKVWHLLNNLCAGANSYLEVGCFKGSTLLAALYNNPVYAVAIDNFIMSPGTRQEFFNNTKDAKFEFHEGDSFTFDIKKIKKPIDLYFYDGDHSAEAQYKALTHFAGALADEFIFVCDDWDLKKMKTCSVTAIKDLGFKLIEMHELRGATAGTLEERKSLFWGGIGILRIKK
jgi:SAM-dependent methyltransferase